MEEDLEKVGDEEEFNIYVSLLTKYEESLIRFMGSDGSLMRKHLCYISLLLH